MSESRPVALITMATGYVGPALARSLASRGYDLVLQGAAGDDTMVGVEVSVDPDTGYVTVERLATVGDVGYAINPALVEGQDLGAATQGLGAALFEQLIYDGEQPVNPNVVDYRVPRTRELVGGGASGRS